MEAAGDLLMRKYLTQVLINESIDRLADAARTENEFRKIVTWFDALDERTQNAYNKKTRQLDRDVFDWVCYRNTGLYEGDILSLLFSCVCQMHDLLEDSEVSALVNKATYKQKNVFFLRVFRGCSSQQIAACLDMTDRNVRDLTDKMVAKIQKGLFELFTKRQKNKISLTNREINFLNIYNKNQKGGVKK